MTDEICSQEECEVLQASEVREHLDYLRIRHARMMGLPPPPLRAYHVRMQQKRSSSVPRKPRDPKRISTTIRLHPRVLEAFKAEGPGWQTRINAALLKLVTAQA